MRNFRMARRAFLAGVGTSALGTMLRPIMAYAQTGSAPQRLLVIHRPCGTSLGTGVPGDAWWWPSGGTTGWTASPLISSFTDGKIAALQNKMVVLKNLSAPRNMNWSGDRHGAGFLAMMTPGRRPRRPRRRRGAIPMARALPPLARPPISSFLIRSLPCRVPLAHSVRSRR
jgi:hypothetical protein